MNNIFVNFQEIEKQFILKISYLVFKSSLIHAYWVYAHLVDYIYLIELHFKFIRPNSTRS